MNNFSNPAAHEQEEEFPEGFPEDELPNQCYECGDYRKGGDPGSVMRVDMDPGDLKVGPQPDICDVWICSKCYMKMVDEEMEGHHGG